MALNDQAVITAATGYVFRAPVGTAAPTPSQVDSIDPETFGAQVSTAKVTGTPTGGTFTLTVGGETTSALAYNATADAVQAAVEALSGVGAGNTKVSGVSLADTNGLDIAFVGSIQGTTFVTSATATLSGGTTPAATFAVKTAANGWKNVGHTSRKKLPEFGFEGGKLEVKGTWQKKRLREIQTGDPVVDSVKLELEQFDPSSFELYYGEDSAHTDGVFGVNGDFNPIECAFLIIIVDGDVNIGFYAPKASVTRDAAVVLTEDDFGALPIKASFLNLGTRRLFDWISAELLPASS